MVKKKCLLDSRFSALASQRSARACAAASAFSARTAAPRGQIRWLP